MVSTSAPQLLRFVYDVFKTKSNEAKKIYQTTTDSKGETWQLTLYPDYPTVALTYKGKRDVNAAISIILRDSRGSVAYERRRGIKQFKGGKTSQQSFLFLIEWSKIINSENEIYRGNDLIIDVEICVVGKSAPPPNPFSQNILKLLDNEDTADVSFDVKDTWLPLMINKPQSLNSLLFSSVCHGSWSCFVEFELSLNETPFPLPQHQLLLGISEHKKQGI